MFYAGFGRLSVSGVRSPLGQPSGVGVARHVFPPSTPDGTRIAARTYAPLQLPGSAGKGRIPMRKRSAETLPQDYSDRTRPRHIRILLRLRSSVGPNHYRCRGGGLSYNLNPSRGSRTLCLTGRVRVNFIGLPVVRLLIQGEVANAQPLPG
jgi:hypothetical protein